MEESTVFNKASDKIMTVFGFDLGTTNSVVSAFSSDGTPEPLTLEYGPIIPSCIMFNEDGTVVVGKDAARHKTQSNVVYSFKKYMGTDHKLEVVVGGTKRTFTALELSTLFVKEVMAQILKFNPQFKGTKRVVVSYPAYFDIPQIDDTKKAFTSNGFEVMFAQQEPTSAGLVFQTIKRIKDPILVFDLGGGTFDAVLMKNELGFPADSVELYKAAGYNLPATEDILEIVDIAGDNRLGGDDIDELAAKKFNKLHNIRVPFKVIHPIAELVKTTMMTQKFEWRGKTYDFTYDLIKEAIEEVFTKCVSIIDPMLNKHAFKNIHCVLCGGSTKSHVIREKLAARFPCSTEIDPDLAVSVGDAITAKVLSNKDSVSVISVVAKHIGIYVDGKFSPIVRKGDVMPARKKMYPHNLKPYAESVNIAFFQTEDLFKEPIQIGLLQLENLTGFNEEGFVTIPIEVIVTADGIIEVSVTNAKNTVSVKLAIGSSLAPSADSGSKTYQRFKAAIEKFGAKELESLLEEFRKNETSEMAQKFNKALVKWREKNGE